MLDQVESVFGPKCEGHFSRLPGSLFSGEADALSDNELIERLLLLTNTRVNARRLAKSSLVQHRSLHKLLTEAPPQLRDFGFNDATIRIFDVVHESSRRLTSAETRQRPLLSDTDALIAYLDIPNRSINTPHLAVMLLNSRNHVLEEITFPETEEPSSIAFSLGKQVLEIHASAVILATIRPGKEILPTPRDVDITRQVAKLAAALNVSFHEHLIFTRDKSYSLKFEVDLTSRSDIAKSLHAERGRRPGTSLLRGRSLGGVADSVSGFSDSGMFATLVVPKNASIKDVAKASEADLVTGSHKLRTLSDHDLMALLLSHVTGKRGNEVVDCAILNCSSFATMLSTPSLRLLELPGLTPHGVAAIKLIHTAAIRLFRAAVMDQPSLDGLEKLTRYLTAALSRENVEHLRILFLDSDGRLRADEAQSRGTVNHAPVYPREVVRRALELKTEFLILVHNHPSGDPTPSQDDIDMTNQIKNAAAILNLKVWDHIIIGNGSWFSFRKEGLLQGVSSQETEPYRKYMA